MSLPSRTINKAPLNTLTKVCEERAAKCQTNLKLLKLIHFYEVFLFAYFDSAYFALFSLFDSAFFIFFF